MAKERMAQMNSEGKEPTHPTRTRAMKFWRIVIRIYVVVAVLSFFAGIPEGIFFALGGALTWPVWICVWAIGG